MRLRLIIVGIFEMLLSVILYILRGYHPAFLALTGIGVVLVILGLFVR
ncbi:MAG: hypothetical protein M1386_02960 [Candidatus Thermoplasmatota archaeon]|nr:hypothetical protein [Candidatus Thermoplasmatota archaeon]